MPPRGGMAKEDVHELVLTDACFSTSLGGDILLFTMPRAGPAVAKRVSRFHGLFGGRAGDSREKSMYIRNDM